MPWWWFAVAFAVLVTALFLLGGPCRAEGYEDFDDVAAEEDAGAAEQSEEGVDEGGGYEGVDEGGGYEGVDEGGYEGVDEGGYEGVDEGGYEGVDEGGYEGQWVDEGGYQEGQWVDEGGYAGQWDEGGVIEAGGEYPVAQQGAYVGGGQQHRPMWRPTLGPMPSRDPAPGPGPANDCSLPCYDASCCADKAARGCAVDQFCATLKTCEVQCAVLPAAQRAGCCATKTRNNCAPPEAYCRTLSTDTPAPTPRPNPKCAPDCGKLAVGKARTDCCVVKARNRCTPADPACARPAVNPRCAPDCGKLPAGKARTDCCVVKARNRCTPADPACARPTARPAGNPKCAPVCATLPLGKSRLDCCAVKTRNKCTPREDVCAQRPPCFEDCAKAKDKTTCCATKSKLKCRTDRGLGDAACGYACATDCAQTGRRREECCAFKAAAGCPASAACAPTLRAPCNAKCNGNAACCDAKNKAKCPMDASCRADLAKFSCASDCSKLPRSVWDMCCRWQTAAKCASPFCGKLEAQKARDARAAAEKQRTAAVCAAQCSTLPFDKQLECCAKKIRNKCEPADEYCKQNRACFTPCSIYKDKTACCRTKARWKCVADAACATDTGTNTGG